MVEIIFTFMMLFLLFLVVFFFCSIPILLYLEGKAVKKYLENGKNVQYEWYESAFLPEQIFNEHNVKIMDKEDD